MKFYYILIIIIGIIGFVLTFLLAKKSEKQEVDHGVSGTTYKHRIIGNPSLILTTYGVDGKNAQFVTKLMIIEAIEFSGFIEAEKRISGLF